MYLFDDFNISDAFRNIGGAVNYYFMSLNLNKEIC